MATLPASKLSAIPDIVGLLAKRGGKGAKDISGLKGMSDSAKRDVLSYVDGLYKQAKNARIRQERKWFLNLAFYNGNHYLDFISTKTGVINKLVEPKVPEWRVRLVVNKIRTIVRTEQSKILQENPRGFVIPSSTDDEDIMAARTGDLIYEHLYREKHIKKIFRRASFWQVLLGNGFIKDWYDSEAIDKFGMADGSPIMGDIMVDSINPFFLYFPDLLQEELEAQPYFIHEVGKDPAFIERTYKTAISFQDKPEESMSFDQRFMTVMGLNSSEKLPYTMLKEIWIKPGNSKFKDGAIITWCNDTLLQVEESSWYRHGQYPLIKLDGILTGKFYTESVVTDLIPLQKEYNKTRSQIIEAKNRTSKPWIIAQKGSIDANKLTSEPGLIVLYNPGSTPPSFETPPPIPSYVVEEMNRTISDMNDISSQHDIAHGTTPSGVTASTAIAYLQEEDNQKLKFSVDSIEEGHEKLGQHLLSHVAQFWDAQRQIKVIGEGQLTEAFIFSNTDLANNTDFHVEQGSAAPRSKAAKQAFIMDLMTKGFIPPDKGLRYMDMAETGRLYEESQLDARQAQRENYIMEKNQTPVSVGDWDNHLAHIDEHNNYRKKESFTSLDPQVQKILAEHVRAHKLKLAATFGQAFTFDPNDPYNYDPRLDGFIIQLRGGNIPPVQTPMQAQSQQPTGVQDNANKP